MHERIEVRNSYNYDDFNFFIQTQYKPIYNLQNILHSRSITMVWVALGHMYMFGIEYPVIFGQYPVFIVKNRGDCENVCKITIKHYLH